MSYESAIKKANDILKVVKFFKENPEYVDDERREVSNGTKITIDSLFDTSNNNCSTIELAYDYISLNRKYDEVTIERHENEESFKISDILSLSTEEGYFEVLFIMKEHLTIYVHLVYYIRSQYWIYFI
ncbi:UNVERIFIED_ORG: hypothetical protein [Escherichia phage CMSTMSU]